MQNIIEDMNVRVKHLIRLPIYLFPITLINFYISLQGTGTILNKLPIKFTIIIFILSNIVPLIYFFWISNKISQGKNWSRLLYTTTSIVSFLISISNFKGFNFSSNTFLLLFFALGTIANFYALALLYGNSEVNSTFQR